MTAPETPRTATRGERWFTALTGAAAPTTGSLLVADTTLAGRPARVLATRPDPRARRPRARGGEIGLDEGWGLAAAVREAVTADAGSGTPRTLVAVVDAPSQAYGYQEELLGIHQALAAAVDAYSAARLAGHPVVALLVGKAISGAFLAHGLQAHRILALADDAVQVQAMSKESAARVTQRTVAELEEAARRVPATAYDGATFATLGAVHELLTVARPDTPAPEDVARFTEALARTVADILTGPGDLSVRLASEGARERRGPSLEVRRRLAAQWED
ncbi:biotin-independent malonate decarboxylase subunit gamma [Streptomyces sp. NPDC059740]|uniref:biotin-independent malonate decarboxylase subunit gamma n=1 Tax=Streptomyces sp. NPDC059740 TaxID=3346926 RepID=UPI003646EC49